MNLKRVLCSLVAVLLLVPVLFAGDLNLEDINFPYDSKKVLDDLKQMGRLVEFVNSDPELLVEISGHADAKGSLAYNKKLSEERAEAVRQLLIYNGIAPNRISIKGFSYNRPIIDSIAVDDRYVNRRAAFSIFKLDNNQRDFYYKDNRFIKDLEGNSSRTPGKSSKEASAGKGGLTNQEILKRLDDLEALIRSMDKKQVQGAVLAEAPAKPAAPPEMPPMPDAGSQGIGNEFYSLSIGPGSYDGNAAGRLDASLFLPTADQSFALQMGVNAQVSEYLQEYQLDAGIVGKYKQYQLGVFGSTKFIKLEQYGKTGNLSQVNIAASRLFDKGSIGLFATEGIKTEDVVSSKSHYEYGDLFINETYLDLSDKYGVSLDYQFDNGLGLYADVGGTNADEADIFGRLRFEYPIFDTKNLFLFVQADYNNGFIDRDDIYSGYIGVTLKNRSRTQNNTNRIRPMEVQDISYEMKTRQSVVKSDVNFAPQVSIMASTVEGSYPLAVTFVGVATDPDGTVVDYSWAFGDDTTGNGATVTHTFDGPGSFQVILTATDDKGSRATASVTIKAVDSLVNAAPISYIVINRSTSFAPSTVTFTGIASDSDGTIAGYEWDFGDGSTGSGSSVSHTYSTVGVYLATLTVTDDHGASTSTSTEIRVYDQPF